MSDPCRAIPSISMLSQLPVATELAYVLPNEGFGILFRRRTESPKHDESTKNADNASQSPCGQSVNLRKLGSVQSSHTNKCSERKDAKKHNDYHHY